MTPHDELMALAGKWSSGDTGDGFDGPDYDRGVAETRLNCAGDLRALLDSDAFRAMVRDVWLPIEVGGKLPAIGEWALVLTDRSALGRADLNFLYPDRPRFEVVPAQLRAINDGWPLWQRWELASGHPVAVLEGDTHWQPLPAPPQAIDAAASGAGEGSP